MRVSYVVSRFPNPSETFIVRELNELQQRDDLELGLLSLYTPTEHFEHESAKAWLSALRRPRAVESGKALAYWLVRKPATLGRALLEVATACRRSPAILVRALATLPLAAAHALHVEDEKISHLHAHFATYPALTAWFAARLTGCTFSLTVHAHDLFVDDSLLRLTIGEASFIATISEFNRSKLEAYGSGTRIEIARAGIQPEAYEFRPREIPTEGPVAALSVASLVEHKGHEVLFEALATPDLARMTVRLVGGGVLREELEQLASRLGISRQVVFEGPMEELLVRDALQEADLFVISSRVAVDGQMEGIPVALMEALASGIPSVATRLSGVPELIEDGRTGWLAEPGDAESLRQTLIRAHSERRPSDPWAGRKRVENEFSVTKSAGTLGNLIVGSASTEK